MESASYIGYTVNIGGGSKMLGNPTYTNNIQKSKGLKFQTKLRVLNGNVKRFL